MLQSAQCEVRGHARSAGVNTGNICQKHFIVNIKLFDGRTIRSLLNNIHMCKFTPDFSYDLNECEQSLFNQYYDKNATFSSNLWIFTAKS